MAYTTLDLIAAIERRSFSPANQLTFSQAEILAMADEELKTTILPRLVAVREEFFVVKQDQAITASQAGYPVPERSIGQLVREIKVRNAGGSLRNLPRIEPEDRISAAVGNPESFFMQNNEIHLYPTPSSTLDTLEVTYFVAPGDFIDPADAAIISSIDTATNTVTVSSIPSSWASGNTFDFISATGMHQYRAVDQVSVTVSGSDIIFSSLPSTLIVGDYVALQGQLPLVQCPPNFRAVLAQATASFILRSQNQPGASESVDQLEKMLQAAIGLITPRVHGEERVMIPSLWF